MPKRNPAVTEPVSIMVGEGVVLKMIFRNSPVLAPWEKQERTPKRVTEVLYIVLDHIVLDQEHSGRCN